MRAIQNNIKFSSTEDKILKGSKEHRFYLFLKDLYEDYTFSSLSTYFKRHKIGIFKTSILIELGHIEQIRYGQYAWVGNQPTVKNAIKLCDTIRKIQKEYNTKYLNKKEEKKMLNYKCQKCKIIVLKK